jgi:hypothetical protein
MKNEAMNLTLCCYNMRFKLVKSEVIRNLRYKEKLKSDEKAIIKREQETSRREKALEDHLKK